MGRNKKESPFLQHLFVISTTFMTRAETNRFKHENLQGHEDMRMDKMKNIPVTQNKWRRPIKRWKKEDCVLVTCCDGKSWRRAIIFNRTITFEWTLDIFLPADNVEMN